MSEFEPKIMAFYCSNCASAAAKVSHGMAKSVPSGVRLVQVPCTGRIETLHLLKPFEDGADAVYVAGCQEDSCQYIGGIAKAAKRVAQVRKILQEVGMEPERIEIFNLSAARGHQFADIALEMSEKIKQMGPASPRTNT
ncbi:MAG: hydrogenase iron-sulfur subunit [Desulfobacteraceae bacterium]|nr:MAG: hydrogenase iron-sulfur subunit [Desulfobacteraceae bacterium]